MKKLRRRLRALIAQGKAGDPDHTLEVIAKTLYARTGVVDWIGFYELAVSRTTSPKIAGGGHYVKLIDSLAKAVEDSTTERAIAHREPVGVEQNTAPCTECQGGYLATQPVKKYCGCKLGRDLARVERRNDARGLNFRRCAARDECAQLTPSPSNAHAALKSKCRRDSFPRM